MKKYFYLAVVALMSLFTASCSQEESLVQGNVPAKTTFNVSLPTGKAITRAADTNVKRYAIAIEGVDLGNGASASKIQDNGTFEVANLINGQRYEATFWADYDAATTAADAVTYDITYLTDVVQKKESHMMAYCGSISFVAGEQTAAYNVTLGRAVAELNLIQASKTAKRSTSGSDWVTVKYDMYWKYNAKTGFYAGDVESQHSTGIELASATAANTTIGTIYLFAPKGRSYTTNMNISFWSKGVGDDENGKTETVGTVSNVPLKANYKTNITGNFNPYSPATVTFSVTAEADWDTTQNNAEFDGVYVADTYWNKSNSAASNFTSVSLPSGFVLPTTTQFTALITNTDKYFGTYDSKYGVLFSNTEIEGWIKATVSGEGSVSVADGGWNHTITADHLKNGIFLPYTTSGNDAAYYWAQKDGESYCYLYFNGSWMVVKWDGAAESEYGTRGVVN